MLLKDNNVLLNFTCSVYYLNLEGGRARKRTHSKSGRPSGFNMQIGFV